MKIILITLSILSSVCAFSFELEKAVKDPAKFGFNLENPTLDFWAKRIPVNELHPDPVLGFSNVKNMQVRSMGVGRGRIIWDVVYDFDNFGRRKTYSKENLKTDQAIIFTGCSFTFGTGLHSHETVPDLIARSLPETKVYNSAIGASGTNQVLGLLRQKNFTEMFPEKKALVVYIFIHDHLIRANGLHPAVNWMQNTPSYAKVDGEMVYEGTIEESHRIRSAVYRTLGKTFYPNNIFPRLFGIHKTYICDLVEASKRTVQKLNPEHDFVFVQHPIFPPEADLIKCLKDRGIKVLQYPLQIVDGDIIKGEGHPSYLFNQKFSKFLLDDLKKILK